MQNYRVNWFLKNSIYQVSLYLPMLGYWPLLVFRKLKLLKIRFLLLEQIYFLPVPVVPATAVRSHSTLSSATDLLHNIFIWVEKAYSKSFIFDLLIYKTPLKIKEIHLIFRQVHEYFLSKNQTLLWE